MRGTTVASVTEQNDFSEKKRRKQLLHTLFDSYILINPTTHPHDPCATLHNNKNLRNTVADTYGAPPKNAQNRQRKQLLRAAFDRHVLIHTSTRSLNSFATLHSDSNLRNTATDTHRHLTEVQNSTTKSRRHALRTPCAAPRQPHSMSVGTSRSPEYVVPQNAPPPAAELSKICSPFVSSNSAIRLVCELA